MGVSVRTLRCPYQYVSGILKVMLLSLYLEQSGCVQALQAERLALGVKNPLVERNKLFLSPLKIKLGLMTNCVKALGKIVLPSNTCTLFYSLSVLLS